VLVDLGGDTDLDQSGAGDLLEMKKVGSTAEVAVAAEFDRGSGRGAKRYLLRKGGTPPPPPPPPWAGSTPATPGTSSTSCAGG
jgi:hypothetical protein